MRTEAHNERSAETLAVARDIALMVDAAAALYDEMVLDLGSWPNGLTPPQRRQKSLKLRTLNRQMLRGAEHLRDTLEADLYMTERWCETYHCDNEHMSLADALGKTKREIQSEFYTETAFNQNPK